MSIEKRTRVIVLGYQVRCSECGVAGPLEETWDDAGHQAAEHGWDVNSLDAQYSLDDYCPVCVEVRRVRWQNLLRQDRAEKLAAAVEWLRAQLAGGPRKVAELRNEAEALPEPINFKTLWRAKELLAVVQYGDRPKYWRLPEGQPQPNTPDPM